MIAWTLALGFAASAAPAADIRLCLRRLDVPCAERLIVSSGAERSEDGDLVAALAQTRFQQGNYPVAFDTMSRAVRLGYVDRYEELAHYERTLYATANWVEERRGRFVVRFRPGVDAILWEEALDAIAASDKNIAPLLGGSPPGETPVELYPDGRSFIGASSLKAEDVYTTGVVGLAKWGKLLITSPRALPRGYGWQDTIAHEYIHLVVAHHTDDRAEVWLQEAIAKYLDSRWHDGTDRFKLTVRQQGLLAEALRRDDLVTFEEMSPSLAKLPNADRAALAYAQLASLMAYCFERAGPDVLLQTLPPIARGIRSDAALAKAAGAPDFDTLYEEWRAWLAAQDIVGRRLAELPTVLDGGDDMDLDPVLSDRQDLVRFVTLGEILLDHGEAEASLVEFTKAVPEGEPPSPILSNRIAQANLALGRVDPARMSLRQSLVDYPEFALSHRTLGAIYLEEGDWTRAVAALREALVIHPFDTGALEDLIAAYTALGDTDAAERTQARLRVRNRGGDDVERSPLHTREGEFELPTYDEHAADGGERPGALRKRWVGEPAPPWRAVTLEGAPLVPADLEGRVVVLDFWATWCGPCKAAMPHLARMEETYGPQGLSVVGLTDEAKSRVEPFLARRPVPYRIAIDVGKRTAGLYEVTSLPTVFVIDRKGRIAEVVVGAGEQAYSGIEAAVKAALQEE